MPSASVVSAVPYGAARSVDLRVTAAGQGPQGVVTERGTGTSPASNNLWFATGGSIGAYGTAGSGVPFNGVWQQMQSLIMTQGAAMVNAVFPWVLRQPLNQFQWPIGRFVFETIMAWVSNVPTGLNYGVFVCSGDFFKPVTTVQHWGFGVYNDAGVLKFINRCPKTLDIIPLGISGAATAEFNRFTFQFQNATASTPAIFTFFLNGVPFYSRTNNDMGYSDGNAANTIFWFEPMYGVETPAGGQNLSVAQQNLYMGPDTDIGMVNF